ncbi:MAG: aminopeptidase N C-terminal domain-containing protein, partial [Gammaproteobacteria bacterium]|nr:aminopeptidase N C-terminal domain-containing protein [Gammaproteobacteria bacterium]
SLADVRDQLITRLAARFPAKWKDLYESNADAAAYSPDGAGVARRRLKNLALRYLVEYLESADPPLALRMIDAQMSDADNLNDRLVALNLVVDLQSIDDVQRRERIEAFYQRYRNEAGVVDLWFSTQAGCQLPGTLQTIEMLESHPAFDIKNPNKVRALYGGFVQNSLRHFHAADGTGYRFFADRVLKIDRLNPQVAARLATQLTRFQRVDSKRADLMRGALRSIDADGASKDLREVVTKGLAGDP